MSVSSQYIHQFIRYCFGPNTCVNELIMHGSGAFLILKCCFVRGIACGVLAKVRRGYEAAERQFAEL